METSFFFLASSKEEIFGKPQAIQETKIKIPLVTEVEKKASKHLPVAIVYKFIDDIYDRRYDGYQTQSFEESFFVYKVVYDSEEFTVFSKEKLGNEYYRLVGMKIKMAANAELTKQIKIRNTTTIFICKDCYSTVKILSPKELIKFTKKAAREYMIGYEEFRNLIFTRNDNKVYLHSQDYNLLRIAQLLSGLKDDYPLHTATMGGAAKGKTFELEAIDNNFQEERGIFEAGSSTPKGLIPSFASTPPNPGYILKCNRIALVDELTKMIEISNTDSRSLEGIKNCLSKMNMLLEWKLRDVGSGKDNFIAKATCQAIFSMNPLGEKKFLHEHINIFDNTFMSRILWFCCDEEEQKFISENRPFYFDHRTAERRVNDALQYIFHILDSLELDKSDKETSKECAVCEGKTKKNDIIYNYNENRDWHIYRTGFIRTLWDSCKKISPAYDLQKIEKIYLGSTGLIQNKPMLNVWDNSRGLHHTYLLFDGILKYRCLFKDYDSTFTPKDEDYDLLEKLIIRIVQSWNVDLSKHLALHSKKIPIIIPKPQKDCIICQKKFDYDTKHGKWSEKIGGWICYDCNSKQQTYPGKLTPGD